MAGRLPLFRTVLFLFVVGGVAANYFLIIDSIRWLRFGSRAYHDLTMNPSAYGRLIAQVKIASLRSPYWLWGPNAAVVVAALVGIFFALYLLLSLVRWRNAPEAAERQMRLYRRWKILAAIATLVAATCAGYANYKLYGTATRHISVGTWDPRMWPLVLFLGALIPRWWIGKALDGRW